MRTGASHYRRLIGSRPLLLCLLAANPAFANAQTTPAPETPEVDVPPAAETPQPPKTAPPVSTAVKEPADAQPIVITGSRIPRPNLTAVSPVSVIQSQEVKLEGVILAEELLNRLPMVSPDQGAFTSNGATGTATVDLRGLGASRTLVLLNGRRMMPGDPRYPAPDINAIPAALIKRVEVLTGGASAVYGSDAVAGVVNFILDTQLQGLRVDAQASFFQHDNRLGEPYTGLMERRGVRYPKGNVVDGGRQDITAAYGTGFLDGRGHVTVYAGYRELSKVTQNSRDYSACALTINRRIPEILLCGGSIAGFPGAFFTRFGAFTIGPNRTFTRPIVPYNFAPWNYFQRPDKRYIGGGFADFEISDAVKPYLEAMYMDDRSAAQIAPSALFFNTSDINCDSPLLSAQQRSWICRTGNFVGEVPIFDDEGNFIGIDGTPTPFVDPVTGATYFRGTLYIGRRNVEGGPRYDDLRHKNLRLLGGVKGNAARGLSYDASYMYGRVKFSSAFFNELSVTRMGRALDVITDPATGQPACRSALTGEDPNCVPWDIFALGAVTQEATDYLAIEALRKGLVREKVATGSVTAQLGEYGIRSPWADEGLALNFGAESRKDYIDYRPDEFYQSGDLAGSFPETPYTGSVNVKELFGEVRVPLIENRLVERLALEGGYRQSWYSNPENRFTSNSFKLALEFIPVRGIRFRGSHQRAVRAPNIVDLFGPLGEYQFPDDPCAGVSPDATLEQCARSGVTPSQYGNIIAVPPNTRGYNAIFGGNPLLEPETATTRTLGLVLEPRFLPGFNATIDWFDINLKGAVSTIDAPVILDTCLTTGDPFFCSRVHRDSKGSLWLSTQGFVDDRNANIGGVKVSGIDVGVNYSRRLGRLGSANFGFTGSRLRKFEIDRGGPSTPNECAGLYGFPCSNLRPRWRHQARLTWESRGGVSLSVHWQHTGKVRLSSIEYIPDEPFNSRDASLPAYNTFDLTALVRLQTRYALRLGVSNIFDRQPPLVANNTTACWNGCNGNTYPQWYSPLGRFVFAGVTIDWKP